MKRLLLMVVMLFASKAWATNCALGASPSLATLTTALAAASTGSCTGTSSGYLVTGSGTTAIGTSTVTIPCNASISGPVGTYSQTPNQTWTFTGSSSNTGWGFQTTAGCPQVSGQNQYIQWIEWNGEQPSNGGGGLRFVAGTTNFTDQYNWWHGVQYQGPTSGGNAFQADLNYFDGSSSGTTSSNVIIEWNVYGYTSFSDCSVAMTTSDMQENGQGGFCNGVGIHNNVTNVVIENNIFHWLEQGMKTFETEGECNPLTVDYNDYSFISRIMYETQCNIGTSSQPNIQEIDYNDFHDRYAQAVVQTYDLSAANGCGNVLGSYCSTHSDYNVYLGNTTGTVVRDVGFEIWGQSSTSPPTTSGVYTSASYNLIQGNSQLFNGITWSRSGNFILNNNTFQMATGSSTSCQPTPSGGYWNYNSSSPLPAYTPVCTGNTYTTTVSTVTSVQPTISPAGGTVAPGTVVTFTNGSAAVNRDANTGIWYTTDGSTPVPGSGTAQYIASGGTYTLPSSGTVTVNAVGMWGQLNQPYSYPSGYGYVPSATTTNTYMITAPTLSSCYQANTGSVNTLTVGGATVQQVAKCYYASVPVTTTCSPGADTYGNQATAWGTTNPAVLAVGSISSGSPGVASGVTAGSGNVTLSVGTTTCNQWTFTVSGPTLTGVSISLQMGGTNVVIGNPAQACATMTYAGVSPTVVCGSGSDIYGTTPSSWTSSATGVATISTSGLVTGVSAGSTNIGVSAGSFTSSPLGITVSNPVPGTRFTLSGPSSVTGTVVIN